MHSNFIFKHLILMRSSVCQGIYQLNKVKAKATKKPPWTFGGPRSMRVDILNQGLWAHCHWTSEEEEGTGNDDKGFLLNLTVSILMMGWKTYNFQEKNQYLFPKLQLKLPMTCVLLKLFNRYTDLFV